MDLRGKRLLVLGGTYATYDLVKLAKSKGVYVIVTDNLNQDSLTKQMADEVVSVSTDDIESLKRLVIDKQIDGAFCGPSEFNINNLVHLCEEVNLPCYCTPKQWSLCSNKKTFKEFCLNNNVPTAKEYHLEEFQNDTIIDYPVIVKPVDGCSSKGISICENSKDVISAYQFALNQSKSKKVIIEQYIDNGGLIFSFRYVLDNGNYYPYLTFDTYIVDPIERKYLISAFTYFPSKFNGVFYSDLDKNIRQM